MKSEVLNLCLVLPPLIGTPGIVYAQGSDSKNEAPANVQDIRFIDTRDQGIHYFKKKKYQHAYRILKRAYGMPSGNTDFLATYYLARSAAKLLLLERAFDLAEQAETLAKDDERYLERVEEFTIGLREQFGKITLVAAEGETNSQGRIFSSQRLESSTRRNENVSCRSGNDSGVRMSACLPLSICPMGTIWPTMSPAQYNKTKRVLRCDISSGSSGISSDAWLVGLGAAAVVALGTGIWVYMLSQDDQADALRIYSLETQ